ncbi:hypothetical protein ACJX0J_014130, partial [Zea mays]
NSMCWRFNLEVETTHFYGALGNALIKTSPKILFLDGDPNLNLLRAPPNKLEVVGHAVTIWTAAYFLCPTV